MNRIYDNPIIKKRFEEKMKRWSQQSLSIQISWAINNATDFVPENLKGTKKGFELVEKWYPEFLKIYRGWMLENMPIEPERKSSYQQTKEAFLRDVGPEEIEIKVEPLK